MKKLIQLLFLLSLSLSIKGQVVDDFNGGALNNFIPTSPEVASLGKYGTIPVDSPNGEMRYSIPIHTINLYGYSFPIRLNYRYSGLLLEGKPSLVGLGWSLQNHGAVVREIRGLPDEHENGYYGINDIKGKIDLYAATGEMSLYDLREGFYKRKYDSEADKYIVNVFGLNFSFKIGTDGNPVFLSKHSNKVEITWHPTKQHHITSFKVIDTRGIHYVFSDLETIMPDIDEELVLNAVTGWNITQIIFPNQKTIDFDYSEDIYESFDFDAIGSVVEEDISNEFNQNPSFHRGVYNHAVKKTTIRRQLLNRITFPNGLISFQLGAVDSRKIYHSILVQDANFNPINQYEFTYEGNRDQLMKITRNQEHWYTFEYYQDPTRNMPDFINSINGEKPLAQDRWKFYNGAPNESAFPIQTTSYNASNEINLSCTKIGALTKIIYPTKGYSEIAYEQNQTRTQYFAESENLSTLPLNTKWTMVKLRPESNPTSNFRTVRANLNVTEPLLGQITYRIWAPEKYNHVDMRISAYDGCREDEFYPGFSIRPFVSLRDKIDHVKDKIQRYLDVWGPYPNFNYRIPLICPEFTELVEPDDPGSGGFVIQQTTGRILIMPGDYDITISTNFNKSMTAKSEIVLDYYREVEPDIPDGTWYNKNVGGIRVASIKDFANKKIIEPERTRRFTYNDDKDLSTGTLIESPIKTKTISRKITRGTNRVRYVKVHVTEMDNYTRFNTSIGAPVYYTSIKTINSDDKIGYTTTSYANPINYGDIDYYNYPKGSDLSRGLISDQKAIKNEEDNAISVQQHIENKYQQVRGKYLTGVHPQQDENPNHPLSFKVKVAQHANIDFTRFLYSYWPSGTEEINAVKRLYHITPYKELDSWFKKTKQITTEIFDNQIIKTETDYTYDTKQQLIETTITDSEQKVKKQKFVYPYNFQDGISVGMTNTNQISQPVVIENYIDNVLLGKQKRLYSLLGNRLYKPTTMSYYKGDQRDPSKQTYFKYNAIGNVVQTQTDDNAPPTSFIWGYQSTLPIASLKNVQFDAIPKTTIDNLKSLSNKDGNLAEENTLRTALQELKDDFPDALVSTYTYNPLVGMTSESDAKGYTNYYKYDNLNRVQYILDKDQYIVKEIQYNHEEELEDEYGELSLNVSSTGTIQPGTPTTFTANFNGSAGQFIYTWKVNGIEERCDNTLSSFTKTFSEEGEYAISIAVFDIQTKRLVEKTLNVSFRYPALANPIVTEDISHKDIVKGQRITYTSSTTNGGSGSYRYEWFVGTIKQEVTGEAFTYNYPDIGTHQVKLRITDLETGNWREVLMNEKKVYNPLGLPSIATANIHIARETNGHFNGENISGGSGNYSYQWLVNGVDKEEPELGFINYFVNQGTYKITLKVIDNVVYNLSRSTTIDFYVYSRPNADLVLSHGAHFLINTPITFTVTPRGGTGQYKHEWYIRNAKQPYTGTKFVHTFTRYGRYPIKYKLIDDIVGPPYGVKEKERITEAHDPFSNVSVSAPSHIVKGTKVTYRANVRGGSGENYRQFEWYLNNVRQSATGSSFTYTHNSTGTYKVKYKVTDTRIYPTHAKWSSVHTLRSYNPMRVTATPGSGYISNSTPNVTFRINTPTGGSGSYTRGKWKIWKMTNPSWRRTVNSTAPSYTFGTTTNGEYEISITITDTKTGQNYTVTMPVIVSRSSGGGGGGGGDGDGGGGDGDCTNCGDQH